MQGYLAPRTTPVISGDMHLTAKMKICLVTRKFDLKTGGIGRISTELRDGLRKRGHEVITVSTPREDLASYFLYTFLELHFKLPKGCDVYHAITPMESIWLPKEKSVATILDLIPITNPKDSGTRMSTNSITRSIGKSCFSIGCKAASRCKKVVSISNLVQDGFEAHFGKRPRVIRLGINEDLEPRPKKNSRLRIGYLGQLIERKGVGLLINSFMRSRLDADLVLGGNGMDKEYFKALGKRDTRIKFPGFIPDEKLVDFYNSLDVFVFPTTIEGYGLPIVEAMACKIPVIVLSNSIIPKEVKNRCIVVDGLDYILGHRDYLEGLCKSVDIEGNYKWAKEHNWNKTVDEYIEVYKEVMNGKKA